MEKNRTNESAKAAQTIVAETHPKFPDKDVEQEVPEIEIEKDADEQVHESVDEIVITEEIDLDEVIHQQPASPASENNEVDLDDLVHRNG